MTYPAVTVAQSPSDVTIGATPLQEVTDSKWFQNYMVFGNNTGLAADPREPFQTNYIIDGSKLTNATYGSNKVGHVHAVKFQGGFSNEATWGVNDPGFTFGANDFITSGITNGDLTGITDFYGRCTEAHVYTPGVNLNVVKGFSAEAHLEAGATGGHIGRLYSAYFSGSRVAAGTADQVYTAYFEAPKGGTAQWSIYAEGKTELAGQLFAHGPTPNTSGPGAPKGAYLGTASNGTVALELSDGTTNFRVSNSSGQLRFEKAGVAVLGCINGGGDLIFNGTVSTAKNLLVDTTNTAGGVGVVGVANAATVPTGTPAGGGVLYVQAGALKYLGSSGTVTVLGVA